MHIIKKILLSLIIASSVSHHAQEIVLPDEVWQPIAIRVLTAQPSDAKNIAFVSKQLYRVMLIPDVIKDAIAKHRNTSDGQGEHYRIARSMCVRAITKPYIETNEKLLHTTELTVYQEEFNKNLYADINYQDDNRNSKLAMVCADCPEYKRNWIDWLLQHGACNFENWDPYHKYALGKIVSKCKNSTEEQFPIYYEIALQLLNTGANPNPYIYNVIDMRRASLMQLFINHGATIQKENLRDHNYVWFHTYLLHGNIDEDALKFLLDQGYDPYKQGGHWELGYLSGYLRTEWHKKGPNAIEIIKKLPPSAKKDRILDLLRQYPKKEAQQSHN